MQRIFFIAATVAAVALAVSPAAAERDATIDAVVFECEEGLSSITVALDSETPAGLFACAAGATLWPQGDVALDGSCTETVVLDEYFKGAKLERVVLKVEDSSSTRTASEDPRGEIVAVQPCELNGNNGPCDASFFGDPPSEENSSEPSGPNFLEEGVSPSWDEDTEVSLSLEEPVDSENSEHLWVALEKAGGEEVALQSRQEQWVAYRLSVPEKSLANKSLCYKCLSYETDTPSVCNVRIDVRVDAGGKSPPSEQSGAELPEELPSADVAETGEAAELPRALRAGVSPRALADLSPNARGAEKKDAAPKKQLTEEEPPQASGKAAGASGANGAPRENATEKERKLPEKPAAAVARGEDSSLEGKAPEEAGALEKGDEAIEGKKRPDVAALSERAERKSEPIRAPGRASPPASSPALRTSAPSDTALASSGPPAALPPEKKELDAPRSEGKEGLKTELATPAGQVKPTGGPSQPEKPLETATVAPPAKTQPETATVAPPAKTQPETATVAPPAKTQPETTTVAPPAKTQPETTTVPPPAKTQPETATVAPPAKTQPETATVAPPAKTQPETTTAPPHTEKQVEPTAAGGPTGERGSEPGESEGQGSSHGSEKDGSSASPSTRGSGAEQSPQNSSGGEGGSQSTSPGETGQSGKVVCSTGQVQHVTTEAFKTVMFQCGAGLILDPPFSATTPLVFDYVYHTCTQHVALTSILPGARFLADEAKGDDSTTYRLTLDAGPPQATTLCYKCVPPKRRPDQSVFTPGCALIVTVAADPNASAASARATWTALTLFSAFVVAFRFAVN
ncbi:SAG-related sequence SRS13 [Toxoplasma gondii GT1]|uniref:SAG-related sequence SRS13 n=3 Tax=Toxoplasma gondii TaxID=5811 RepID=S7UKA0_TOXGG|nr:SAG-related sequence SRS13 [Toxoplasma gondii GT1]KAF4645655.1 SAG-related sequence SRS13 [Toxoplasma gondii]